ncbi:hypothetical protein L484_007278 [Morus notabilis]|uniref:F-box associated beta-propeller type 3 domain-containing protein n=1 Tax=Morus notabilis TaxID=981085 RepID=W9QZK3_9ROSA|nr:hypothetical protein L484_007278 [Morus notabilis]
MGFGSDLSKEMGFGYDSRTEGYKIVRILAADDAIDGPRIMLFDSDRDDDIDGRRTCPYYGSEVTTLGSSIWRKNGMLIDSFSLRSLYSHTYCKGVFYWMTYSIEGVILAFDMCEEIFRCIKPPNDVFVCDGSHWRTDLMAWNGSLVLLFDNPSRGQMSEPRFIDMWVMNDNNGGGRRGSNILR